MSHYKYVIIGGGMAADAAVKGIREIDKQSPIALVSSEPDPPYRRPPLTKGLWKGKPEESIWLHTEDFGIAPHLGCTVKSFDAQGKKVFLENRAEITYDKLLIATGGTPRRLPMDVPGVIYYRTFEDYKHLRRRADIAGRFAVIGGGFIGSEIAAALAMNNKKVTMIFPEDTVCARVFSPELAGFVTDYYRDKGVNILSGDTVDHIEKHGAEMVVRTKGGHKLTVDAVVAGLGIIPNTELAQAAGIGVDNGIHVDERLRTNVPDIYSAGDVANFYNPLLDKRIRIEHEDNAVSQGRHAGRNMAGESAPFTYLPYFYSDLFDLGYEAVGELNSSLETYADWKEPFKEGVIYYLRESRVRGVLLWNVWEKLDTAREVIGEPGPFADGELRGRITG